MKYRLDGVVFLVFCGFGLIAAVWLFAWLCGQVFGFLEGIREWGVSSPIPWGLLILLGGGLMAITSRPTDSRVVRTLSGAILAAILYSFFLGCGWVILDLLGVSAANWVERQCAWVFFQRDGSWVPFVVLLSVFSVLGYLLGVDLEEIDEKSKKTSRS